MRAVDEDDELRAAAFAFLRGLVSRSGGFVTRRDLQDFVFKGEQISLEQHMRGIRHIQGHPAALSILTTYRKRPEDRPYEDDIGDDGYPRYKWQGNDPSAADNVAVRRAMELAKPLVWFRGMAPGLYEALFPVWIVGEEPSQRQFILALDEALLTARHGDVLLSPADVALRREYALAVVRQRLHQPQFRRRVLLAYRQQCALCNLRHPELLDAAHIKEDAEGGQPIITNGIAMCAIHHRAFDSQVLGISPKYVIDVRKDVRDEHDGPTLQHSLQGLHRTTLTLPRYRAERPDRQLLEERYERFLAAG